MKKSFLLLHAVTILFSVASVEATEHHSASTQRDLAKIHNLDSSLRVVNQILKLAKETKNKVLSSSPDAPEFRRVDRLIVSIKDKPELLARVAVLSRAMSYPQSAEDVYVDNYLDRAFWQGVTELAKERTEESRQALGTIRSTTGLLSGGDKMRFESIIARAAPK